MTTTQFIIGTVCFLVAIGLIAMIVQKSKEYGMKVFLSSAFWTMFIGILLGIAAYFMIEPQENGIIVGGSIAALSYVCAAIINIKKSNVAFGLVFTTFQALMTTCFFLIVFAIFYKFERWRAGH